MTPKRRNRKKVEEEDKKGCERLTSMRTIIGKRKAYDRYDVRSVGIRGKKHKFFIPTVPEPKIYAMTM